MKQAPISIVYSCTETKLDSSICEELDEQLAMLRYNGTIKTWSGNRILPGLNSAEELKNHFENANIILLFISARFFSNQACIGQMNRALERAKAEGTLVIPIIIGHFDVEGQPYRSSATITTGW